MPLHDLEAVFYAGEAPIIELREGMFFIAYTIGNYRFDVVMAPNVYLRALRAANKCAAGFHAGRDNVVVLPTAEEKSANGH